MNLQKKRVAVTGINGFVGQHLARELANRGASIIGIGYDGDLSPSISHIVDEYCGANLVDAWPLETAVDCIIHLAGFAAVGPSFNEPQKYINGNSAMVTNMCEAYVNKDLKPRVIIVSSGAIYDSNQSMPLSEDSAVGYNSPYAVSKIATENQGSYYRSRGLDCVVVRPFNHIGPGQAEGFLLPDLYAQLKTGEKSIMVGNLDTRRDYTDVRDIVKAYTKLALEPSLKHHLYNLCTGASVSGGDILASLKNMLDKQDIVVEVDQSKVRPNDVMDIVGDSSRLRQEFSWKPEITMQKTIQDFIDSKD